MAVTSGVVANQLIGGDLLSTDLAGAAFAEPHVTWRGKRGVDLVLSITLVLVTLPLFLVIALAVRLTSRGPVLFRQRRVGLGGREFSILKFRTMRADAQEQLLADPELQELFVSQGHKIPGHIDPRVTRVGRTLRRLSLDELPQLLNVVTGHMSLVGPRPVERSQLDRDYTGYEAAYLRLRPGLTGLWQVSGRSTVPFPARAEMDTTYADTCGPWVDIKILARTPLVIVSGVGAS
jgi:lipopolysaccharide/colanic/teichoic acid biosynthesis glycosyltransferase